MAQASATLKKGHLELGGKSALIVRHDAEAGRLANESDYWLAGANISGDAGPAMKMAPKMRARQILIYHRPGGLHPDRPFGGYKRSGIGRECGEEGYNEYAQLKPIGFRAG